MHIAFFLCLFITKRWGYESNSVSLRISQGMKIIADKFWLQMFAEQLATRFHYNYDRQIFLSLNI